jgi:hypothetical protein
MTETAKDTPTRTKQGKFTPRVSAQMKQVIQYMVEKGLPLPAAAEQANMTRDAAVRAFNRPHVKTYFKHLVTQARDNAAQMAYLRINAISETAENERLKYDASRWVAGVDGISPVQKVEGRHQHNIAFGGFDYPDLSAKDVTPDTQHLVSDDDD